MPDSLITDLGDNDLGNNDLDNPTVNPVARALIESKIDLQSLALVSGIGCTGRVAGYVKLDSFHTTHGRAIPFATGLKLANPNLNVVVYSGDGDLSAIG